MGTIDVQFGVDFASDSNTFEFPSGSAEAAGKFQQAPASGLESNQVSSATSVPLDLSSMTLTKGQAQQQLSSSSLEGYSSSNQVGGSVTASSQAAPSSQHTKELSQQNSSLSSISQKV